MKKAAPWIAIAIVLSAGFAAYMNSFYGEFVFDDERHILFNPDIRTLWPLSKSMFTDLNVNRPLIGLSLAINYAISNYDTFSYHVFNLVIHLLAALPLFGIVHRLCRNKRSAEWCQKLSLQIATTSALLWVIHPLNITAVTYIIQRFQSMMGLFYFLTAYLAIRFLECDKLDAKRKTTWALLTSLAAISGMLCKQDMVTAPIAVLVVDRLFFSSSFKSLFKNHILLYGGLLISLVVLLIFNQLGPVRAFAGFGNSYIIPFNYALTELHVINRYLGLAFLPLNPIFDYRLAPVTSITDVIPEAIVVVVLLSFSIWLLIKEKKLGLIGAWFFLGLAVTSSIMPIADAICEYRMYVPLAAITTMISLALWKLTTYKKANLYFVLIFIVLFAGFLGAKTFETNETYETQYKLWLDVTKKRPQNARAWNNLGILTERGGDVSKAHEMYKKAYETDPGYIGGIDSMARVAMHNRDYDMALKFLGAAIDVSPHYASPYYQVAKILVMKSRYPEAEEFFKKAIERDPYLGDAFNAYGTLLLQLNRTPEAIQNLKQAVAIDPGHIDFNFNLGTAYAVAGQLAEAEKHLVYTIQRAPNHRMAILNLAILYHKQGRYKQEQELRDQLKK